MSASSAQKPESVQLARAIVEALRAKQPPDLEVVAWNDYLSHAAAAS